MTTTVKPAPGQRKPINSRTKGSGGERELCHRFEELLSVTLARNLQQTRKGGHDLIVTGGEPEMVALLERFAVEVKRAATAPPCIRENWWRQAQQQADRVSREPLLAWRIDRQAWRIVLPMRALTRRETHAGVAELSLDSFAEWARTEAA